MAIIKYVRIDSENKVYSIRIGDQALEGEMSTNKIDLQIGDVWDGKVFFRPDPAPVIQEPSRLDIIEDKLNKIAESLGLDVSANV